MSRPDGNYVAVQSLAISRKSNTDWAKKYLFAYRVYVEDDTMD